VLLHQAAIPYSMRRGSVKLCWTKTISVAAKDTTMAVNNAQGGTSPPPTQVRFDGTQTLFLLLLPVRAVKDIRI